MTQISIALAVDAPGGRQGVPGLLTATAQRLRTDDATVIIPGPVDFPIAATGTTVVNLDSPGPDWSWHLKLSRKGGTVPDGFTRIVAPYPNMDTDFGSVDFEDGVAVVAAGHPLIEVFKANGYAVDDGTSQTLVTERDVVFGNDPLTWAGLVDVDPATRLPTAQPAAGLTPLILDAIAKFSQGDPSVQVAAVAAVKAAIVGQQLVPGAVLDDAWGWAFALYYQGTREVAFGIKSDGTVYPTQPLAAKSVKLASLADEVVASLPPAGSVVGLDDSQGWAFAIYYAGTKEVAFGIRTDGTMYPQLVAPAVPATGVTIHGDSLAAGWAAYNATGELATLTGRAVTVDGIGGQRTVQVAARQGGAPTLLTVAGDLIPASGSVAVTAWSVDLLAPPTAGFSTIVGSLGGVKGTLRGGRNTGDTVNTYTFTRTTTGAAMPVPPGTPFSTGTPAQKTIPVFIQGRNDIGSGAIGGGYGFRTPLAEILASIEKELSFSPNRGRAILLAPLPTTDERNRPADGSHPYDQLVTAMRTTFPAHFADWGAYLRSDAAFAAAGITKTAQDIQDIADGVTPSSFRGDSVHPQATGYKASNAFLAAIITSRD